MTMIKNRMHIEKKLNKGTYLKTPLKERYARLEIINAELKSSNLSLENFKYFNLRQKKKKIIIKL